MRVLPFCPESKDIRETSWDLQTNILRCKGTLGAAIYVGRTDGRGLVSFIGIGSSLRAQALFDTTTDSWAISESSGTTTLAHLDARKPSSPNYSHYPTHPEWVAEWRKTVHRRKKILGPNSEWNSMLNADHVKLDLGQWTTKTIEHDTSFLKKKKQEHVQRWEKSEIEVGVNITDEVINNQKMFVVRFNEMLPPREKLAKNNAYNNN